MRENIYFFNIRKSSKFIFNIKNSFSNIKKINDINFINIENCNILFKNIYLNFKYFFIINIKIVLI